MKGRKPKPSELKRLSGNPGRRPIEEHVPRLRHGMPECPPHLDAAAKVEWKRISVQLMAVGLLTKVDRAALAAYCQTYSRWAEAEGMIKAHGILVKGMGGFPLPNPALRIADRAMDQMLKFLTEFGMSPSSRSRVTAAHEGQLDMMEEYLFGEDAAPDPARLNHGDRVQ